MQLISKILKRKEGYILLIVALLSFYFYNSSTSSEKFNSLETFYSQELSWNSCYDYFECSTLKVPIDYESIETGSLDRKSVV